MRKLGFFSRLASVQSRSGREYKRRKTAGSSNCRSARLFLSVSAHDRRRHFADKALEFGEDLSVNLHPLMRNLNERFAEGEIEGVFFAADAVEAPAQDALEVVGRDQIGERPDGGWLYPGFHQGRDGGMDLIAAQPQRPRRQGAWASIGRKRIGDARTRTDGYPRPA